MNEKAIDWQKHQEKGARGFRSEAEYGVPGTRQGRTPELLFQMRANEVAGQFHATYLGDA